MINGSIGFRYVQEAGSVFRYLQDIFDAAMAAWSFGECFASSDAIATKTQID